MYMGLKAGSVGCVRKLGTYGLGFVQPGKRLHLSCGLSARDLSQTEALKLQMTQKNVLVTDSD